MSFHGTPITERELTIRQPPALPGRAIHFSRTATFSNSAANGDVIPQSMSVPLPYRLYRDFATKPTLLCIRFRPTHRRNRHPNKGLYCSLSPSCQARHQNFIRALLTFFRFRSVALRLSSHAVACRLLRSLPWYLTDVIIRTHYICAKYCDLYNNRSASTVVTFGV